MKIAARGAGGFIGPSGISAQAPLGFGRRSSLGKEGRVIWTHRNSHAIQFWISCICKAQYRTQEVVTTRSIQYCSSPAEWPAHSSDGTARGSDAEEGGHQ